MSTGKYSRRAIAALTVALGSFALVTAADKGEAPSPSVASATNSVVVESQVMIIGTTETVVGVAISNTDPIAGFLVPLEIRPLTPGTSIADTIIYQMNPLGRVANSPLGYADSSVDSLWPEATRVHHQSCEVCPQSCSGPISNTYCVGGADCNSPTGPYGLFFGTVSMGDPQIGELINLDPGADPVNGADASLQIILSQMSPDTGIFEIDTACWTPANSIGYVLADGNFVTPSFTKGIIERRCDCSCHADVECDGVTNIVDVVTTVSIVFRGYSLPPQPFCPRLQADVNCDGVTDIQDVVLTIEVAFRGADLSLITCDPCDI